MPDKLLLSPVARAAVAAALVLLLTAGAGLALDLDRDGIRTWSEVDRGSHPLRPDTDRDGLNDGAELRWGTDPLRRDTDGDGLVDGDEVRLGGDPTRGDTDGDGIPDALEPDVDCNGNGVPAIADSDDDGDMRPDGQEPLEHRCDPDVDQDGVLDGEEGSPVCVELPDCDGDGLGDAEELAAQYDMLRADTFGTGLPDAVAYAFQQQGQTPTPDDDGDGIPDGWEGSDGAIAWGELVPRPGQRDLLIEYLRVVGPDSGRYAWLDFTPAYERVATLFAKDGIHVHWKETLVERPVEHRPAFLSEGDLPYFRSVLDNGTASTNPYVTTVVLNPQQVQQHPGTILGAAFLRSMVSSIDYGAHTQVHFRSEDGQTQSIRPSIESQLIGGLAFEGYDDGGVLPDGRLYLHRPATFNQQGHTMSWRPDWFRTAPYYETDDGEASLQMDHAGATLHTAELASTIAHELGHTLGLCHTHEAECQMLYGGLTTADLHASTMSYASQQTTLHFLGAEWSALGEYLRCPPQETTALVAQGAPRADVLAAKYDRAFTEVAEQRECLELPVLAASLVPVPEPTLYRPDSIPNPGSSGLMPAVLLALVGAAAAGGAGFFVWRRAEPPDQGL